MSAQDPPAEPVDDRQAVPDAEAAAGRIRLAEWLNSQGLDYTVTPEALMAWSVRREAEFLVFVPPGYANQVFLVAEHGISWYAPSRTRFDDALVDARSSN